MRCDMKSKSFDGIEKVGRKHFTSGSLSICTQSRGAVEADWEFVERAETLINDPNMEYRDLRKVIKELNDDKTSKIKMLLAKLNMVLKKINGCAKAIIMKRLHLTKRFCKIGV